MRPCLRLLGFMFASFFLLTGFGKPRSRVAVEPKLDAKTLTMRFVVQPDEGIAVNSDGPWLLSITKVEGLKLEMKDGKFESKAYDEKIPGFEVKAETLPDAKEVKVDYTMRAFVCTADKKQCYQDQHKGTYTWNAKS